MFDLLDLFLLRRGIPADDQSLAFRRIDGNPNSRIIYFLPWNTRFAFARQSGMMPLDFLAAYEMPPAIVSSDPDCSVRAVRALIGDAGAVLDAHGVSPRKALIVGLSVGTYPATFLASRFNCRLISVAGADRPDLTLWQSPAGRIVKRRALQKGRRLGEFCRAMRDWHPAKSLADVARDSMFVVGTRDPFIPRRRAAALLDAIERHLPSAQVIKLDAGHLKTLILSGRFQRKLAGVARKRWIRLPAMSWGAGESAAIAVPAPIAATAKLPQ
jgi:hypothetical protein